MPWKTEGKDGGWVFDNVDDMIEDAEENCTYMDPYDFECWLDENYDASDIIQMCREQQFTDSVYIDLEDEYNEYLRKKYKSEFEDGKDFEAFGIIYRWYDEDGDWEEE